MSLITGRIEVSANSELLLNKEGAVASGLGESGKPTYMREPISGPTGLHGYKETFVPSQVEVTITDRDDVKISDLNAINGNGTIVFRAANGGNEYIMNNATCHSAGSLTGGEGEYTLVFSGPMWVHT